MTKGKISIAVVLWFCTSVGIAFSGNKGLESPEGFIRNMFAEHMAQYDNVYWFDIEIILSKYFDKNMTALFLEDQKCKEWTEELCYLDFDPIIDGQDYDEKQPTNIQVKIARSKRGIMAIVMFDTIQPRGIIFKITNTKKGLRISDNMYGNGKSSLKELLLEKIKKSKKLKSNKAFNSDAG